MRLNWQVKATVEKDREAELAGLFKALAHPVRIHLLRELIREGATPCGDLARGVDLAQSTVSQHLKVLRTGGLVEVEKVGQQRRYRVRISSLNRLRRYTNAI